MTCPARGAARPPCSGPGSRHAPARGSRLPGPCEREASGRPLTAPPPASLLPRPRPGPDTTRETLCAPFSILGAPSLPDPVLGWISDCAEEKGPCYLSQPGPVPPRQDRSPAPLILNPSSLSGAWWPRHHLLLLGGDHFSPLLRGSKRLTWGQLCRGLAAAGVTQGIAQWGVCSRRPAEDAQVLSRPPLFLRDQELPTGCGRGL